MSSSTPELAEAGRLEESRRRLKYWKRWGPYLSERAWGTVREDYSPGGSVWDYFPHDHARSRAYRWNEDGLGGHLRPASADLLRPGAVERPRSDPQGAALRPDRQRRQSRRGREGVLLLSRQHADAFVHEVPLQVPAGRVSLRARSSRRTAAAASSAPEFELIDTGVFADDRYFDVGWSTPRRSPEDILIQITSPTAVRSRRQLDLLPTLWFRNTWSWAARRRTPRRRSRRRGRAHLHCELQRADTTDAAGCIATGSPELLFTENETNTRGSSATPDGASVRQGRLPPLRRRRGRGRGQSGRKGTKAARPYSLDVPAGDIGDGAAAAQRRRAPRRDCTTGERVRTNRSPMRRREADEFYATIHSGDALRRRRERRAAGVRGAALVEAVLPLRREGLARRRPGAAGAAGASASAAAITSGRTSTTPTSSRCPTSGSTRGTRPGTWRFTACRWRWSIRSSPRSSSLLLLREWYMHPNGQLPAYEWAFGDVNPPVHAWAALARLQDREEAPRHRRPHVPRARVPEAAAQLHVVGEPQGRRRQQRLPGRLPRARQHRRVRPQRAAADRRAPRAVRRHQLDGDVLPQHARDRAGAGPRERRLRRRREQVLGALPVHRPRDERRRLDDGTDTICGTKRTASSTTSCTRRTTIARRCEIRSLVGLIPLFAVETLEPDALDQLPDFTAPARMVHPTTGPIWPATSPACGRPARASGGCSRSWTATGCGACCR